MNPASVSSAERTPPPTADSASRTTTWRPARASVIAAASPFGPDPTTTASWLTRAAQPISARTVERASRTISRAMTMRWISFVPS